MRVPTLDSASFQGLFPNLVVLIVFVVWLIAMVAVPIIARRGRNGQVSAISLGVIVQAVLVATVLFSNYGFARTAVVVVVVPFLGWLAEFVGSRTGVPFGSYEYTEALRPQIHRVPIVIPFAWLMMLPPSWVVAQVLFPSGPLWLQAVVAGLAFTAWDVYLDPQMVGWQFWTWNQKGSYLGIPLINFFGWFFWGALITFLVRPAPITSGPLLVVYGITWLLMFGGHFVFWRMRTSAVAGFVSMGTFTVLAAWAMLF